MLVSVSQPLVLQEFGQCLVCSSVLLLPFSLCGYFGAINVNSTLLILVSKNLNKLINSKYGNNLDSFYFLERRKFGDHQDENYIFEKLVHLFSSKMLCNLKKSIQSLVMNPLKASSHLYVHPFLEYELKSISWK